MKKEELARQIEKIDKELEAKKQLYEKLKKEKFEKEMQEEKKKKELASIEKLKEEMPSPMTFDERFKRFMKLKEVERERLFKRYKELSEIKETADFKLSDFQTDTYFIKKHKVNYLYHPIKFLMDSLSKDPKVMVIMHRHDNIDQVKYFPFKNYIVTINDTAYLFNPKHFRFIDGQAVLYAFYGNPFCKLIDVSEQSIEPTISSESFKSVLDSKYVQDAVAGEQMKGNMVIYVLLAVMIINLMASAGALYMVYMLQRSLGG